MGPACGRAAPRSGGVPEAAMGAELPSLDLRPRAALATREIARDLHETPCASGWQSNPVRLLAAGHDGGRRCHEIERAGRI